MDFFILILRDYSEVYKKAHLFFIHLIEAYPNPKNNYTAIISSTTHLSVSIYLISSNGKFTIK